MTQKDKELSFIDISGRLHYGVMVNYKENEYDHRKWKITTLHTLSYDKSGSIIDTDSDGWISYEEHEGCGMSTGSRPFRFGEVLPYLRPMSSMTEEECRELTEITITSPNLETAAVLFRERHYEEEPHWRNDWAICSLPKVLNWLNAHHFDYRGLIEKGLAIEVTEENNPYKE